MNGVVVVDVDGDHSRLGLDKHSVFAQCVEQHVVGGVVADDGALGSIDQRTHGIGPLAAGGDEDLAGDGGLQFLTIFPLLCGCVRKKDIHDTIFGRR